MTELLSKEKEFLKLNEQLDKIATNVMEHHQPQQSSQEATNSAKTSSAGSSRTVDTRFLTYQKAKGQSTLLKKRGAGDCISELVNITNTIATNKEQRACTKPSTKATGGETYRQYRCSYDTATSSNTSSAPNKYQGHSTISTNIPKYRHKMTTGTETSSSQIHNRLSNTRGPTNTSTFTVKYRNPKFVESPSLEVLVRDECSSVRCQNVPLRNDSVASMAIDDGRRSQTSNTANTSKKNISTDGLIKFLKSKITILEEDHDRISQEMSQQKELLDKALERSKLVEQQRDQALAKHITTTEQLTKVERQLEEANQRVKERSLEYTTQQKELETVKRELKILSQNNNNLEKRLYRANEDLENARNALTVIKNSEREQKEALRIESETKDKQIKSLKKQRADLLNAYKKQLFLIDNLKRQNICMEQSKMIAFGEKEFSKVLEWNMKS